jgi:hypothetical protein
VTPLPGGVLQPFEHSVTRTAAVIKSLSRLPRDQ